MKTLAFFLTILSFLNVTAQSTFYLDKSWHQTSKEKATYYRVFTMEKSGYKIEDYYLNGNLQMSGFTYSFDTLKPDHSFVKDGMFIYYNEDGKIESQGLYKNNETLGEWKTFYPNGSLYIKKFYNGKSTLNGEFTVYYKDGKIRRSDTYSNGELKKGNCYTNTGNDTTWYPFNIMPKYPGGDEARLKYFTDNIEYPQEATENGIQGTVYVSFIVGKDGNVEEVNLLRGVYGSIDEEALRVMKNMPKWEPGQLDGELIRVQYNIPIYFKLTNKRRHRK